MRATRKRAADHLANTSSVPARVDRDRIAVMGRCGAPHQADLAGPGTSEYRDTCPHVA